MGTLRAPAQETTTTTRPAELMTLTEPQLKNPTELPRPTRRTLLLRSDEDVGGSATTDRHQGGQPPGAGPLPGGRQPGDPPRPPGLADSSDRRRQAGGQPATGGGPQDVSRLSSLDV